MGVCVGLAIVSAPARVPPLSSSLPVVAESGLEDSECFLPMELAMDDMSLWTLRKEVPSLPNKILPLSVLIEVEEGSATTNTNQ